MLKKHESAGNEISKEEKKSRGYNAGTNKIFCLEI